MALQVHTAQIRYVKSKLPDAVDTSRVGNWLARKAKEPRPGEIFAPSWELLNDVKAGVVTQAQYDVRYIDEMRISYRLGQQAWKSVLARPRVVLCCYEPFGEHCHRHILREYILPALGAVDAGEIR